MTKNLDKNHSFIYSIITVILAVFIVVGAVWAWTEPSIAPPGGNVPAPLNAGSAYQEKAGDLWLKGSLGITNGLIVESGNVGIGTAAPGGLLDVFSTDTSKEVYLTANYAATNQNSNSMRLNFVGQNQTAGFGIQALNVANYGKKDLVFYGHDASDYTTYAEVMRIKYNGNVGIGTVGPNGKLEISEDGVLSATDGNLLMHHPSSGGYSSIVFPSISNYGSDYGYIAYYDDNDNYNYWGNSGENSALVIGIQNDGKNSVSDVIVLKSPAAVVVDAPEIRAPAFYYTSDITLKKEINVLENSLEKVLNLQGVKFRWKDSDELSIGLIAQDVEKIFPEVISGSEYPGLKSIDYGKLVAPLIEAIKEQQKEIEELRLEIEKLKQ